MLTNDCFLNPKVESKLRQVIFGDLVSDKFGLLYKCHTQKSVELIKKLAVEPNLSQSDTKILIAAAYGLHWGCANLCKGFDAHFDNPFKHQIGCLRLASSKIERFLYYYASKDFSQKEILEVVMIIEEQEAKSFDEGSLSSIMFKATITSWAEMIVKQELCGVSEHQTSELVKVGKNYLKKEQTKIENELLKKIV